MKILSPVEAAKIAQGVYNARERMLWTTALRSNLLQIGGMFELAGDRFEGQTGGYFISSRTGFGYVAQGIGAHKGEALIAVRGTYFASLLDWLTDFRFGAQKGSSGRMVHAGFNNTFNSCVGAMDKAVRSLDPSHIHIVGHSLGGAVATLAADYFHDWGRQVTLYTFGSPRVGCLGFANDFNSKMGEDRVYRARHSGDPVAMVPVYPYLHVRPDGPEYLLPWPSIVSPAAHSMDSYIDSLTTVGTWQSIRDSSPQQSIQQSTRRMLESGAPRGLGMFSAPLLRMIAQALSYLCQSDTQASGVIITAGATVIDQLAALLYRGAMFAKDTLEHVTTLMRMIFRFLGRPTTTQLELTTTFIRWVLGMLYSTVQIAATRSLARLHQ